MGAAFFTPPRDESPTHSPTHPPTNPQPTNQPPSSSLSSSRDNGDDDDDDAPPPPEAFVNLASVRKQRGSFAGAGDELREGLALKVGGGGRWGEVGGGGGWEGVVGRGGGGQHSVLLP